MRYEMPKTQNALGKNTKKWNVMKCKERKEKVRNTQINNGK